MTGCYWLPLLLTHLALYLENFTRIEELFANDLKVTLPYLDYPSNIYAHVCPKYASFSRLVELTAQVVKGRQGPDLGMVRSKRKSEDKWVLGIPMDARHST